MRPSPGLVLAAVIIGLTAALTRLLLPGRGPVAWTVLLSCAGLVGGEVVAGTGHLAAPSLGVVHPLPDLVAIGVLQGLGALVAAPRRTA